MVEQKYKIQNIIATSHLGKPVNLSKIAEDFPNAEYNPEAFPGLVLRIKEPKASVLIFSSGKIICTGSKTMQDSEDAIDNTINQLNLKYK